MTTTSQGYLSDHIQGGIEPFPGAVVVARITSPKMAVKQNRPELAEGKLRPCVLKGEIEHGPKAGQWVTWGLTTLTHFREGQPRLAASGIEKVGLGDGYCWGGAPVVIMPDQIVGVVWAAPPELVLSCAMADKTMGEAGSRLAAERISRDIEEAGWYWPKWAS